MVFSGQETFGDADGEQLGRGVYRCWPGISALRGVKSVMESEPKFKQRTDWAEHSIAELARCPLISESVYHSPQRLDKTQKEVTDILLALGNQAIVLSVKCQQEPGSRSIEKESLWATKAAGEAFSQIKGALRAIRENTFWCDHPRRGRVHFDPEQLLTAHALILVEVVAPATLTDDLPLHHEGVPVSYFSASDFCNIVDQLRSIPEIIAYLTARLTLPFDARRTVGNEKSLYGYYLLRNESFDYCLGADDAGILLASQVGELEAALDRKLEADRYSGLIERVADCLAERNPNYLDGLSVEEQDFYDPSSERRNYLLMQEELCNLRLGGRALLGRHFASLMEKVERADPPAMTYAAVHSDHKPDL
jgi:dsDNA-binding SOS-regulon protein